MKWTLIDGKVIDNSIGEIAKYNVLVSVDDISKLKKHGIKYTTFSPKVCKAKFIMPGKKHKRFNSEDQEVILQDIKTFGIRGTARKYDASTSTIQSIKNGTY